MGVTVFHSASVEGAVQVTQKSGGRLLIPQLLAAAVLAACLSASAVSAGSLLRHFDVAKSPASASTTVFVRSGTQPYSGEPDNGNTTPIAGTVKTNPAGSSSEPDPGSKLQRWLLWMERNWLILLPKKLP